MGKPSTDQIGSSYEAWVAAAFGFEISTDRRHQIECGDTICGTEIKFDRRLHKTGNVYIEQCERRSDRGNWILSGPYKSRCQRYAIGDCSRIVFLSPCYLRQRCELVKKRWDEWHSENASNGVIKVFEDMDRIVTTPTSCGILLKFDYAAAVAGRGNVYYWPGTDPLACERSLAEVGHGST
jgi:hypothetical protein